MSENIQVDEVDSNQPKKVRKGFQIAGFILSIWSIFFFLVPFINLVPATLGLIFSLVSIRRKNLRGLSITGIVLSSVALIGTLIISISFSVYTLRANDRQQCQEFTTETEQLNTLISYMEADLTAQNMTGIYDLDSVERQLKVVEFQIDSLSAIEGSEEFNTLRNNVTDGFQRFITFSRAKVTGSATSLKQEDVTSKVETSMLDLAIFCEAQ